MPIFTAEDRSTLSTILWDHLCEEYPVILDINEDPWTAVEAVDRSNPEERKRECEYMALLEVLMYLQNNNEDTIHEKCAAYSAPLEDMPLYIEGPVLDRHIAKWRLAIGK